MTRTEFEKLINNAIADHDFERALDGAISRYGECQASNTPDEKWIALKLIRGLAGTILEKDSRVKSAPSSNPTCDYCNRVTVDCELTQGHGGTICHACVTRIFESFTKLPEPS